MSQIQPKTPPVRAGYRICFCKGVAYFETFDANTNPPIRWAQNIVIFDVLKVTRELSAILKAAKRNLKLPDATWKILYYDEKFKRIEGIADKSIRIVDVRFDWRLASRVVHKMHILMLKYDLMLFDVTHGKKFSRRELWGNTSGLEFRERVNVIMNDIRASIPGIWKILKVARTEDEHSYVIILEKSETPLEQYPQLIVDVIKRHFESTEHIECLDDCIALTGTFEKLVLSVEAYGASPDRFVGIKCEHIICYQASYMEHFDHLQKIVPHIVPMRCQGAWASHNRAKKYGKGVYDRLGFKWFSEYYLNPSRRFAASVKLEKTLELTDKFGLIYQETDGCGCCFTFEDNRKSNDRLYIDEDHVQKVLDPLEAVGGHVETYSFENPVPYPVVIKWQDELKRTAWSIMHDPKAPFLENYFRGEDLALVRSESKDAETKMAKKQLYALFDIVINWIEWHWPRSYKQDEYINISGL